MKRVLCALLVLILLAGAFLLGRMTAPGADSKTFYAVIDKADGAHFLVTGLEVNDINHRWQFQFTAGEGTALLWRGEELTAEELDVGDTVAITYTGSVLEISPAVIQNVLKIELLDDER